MSWLKPGNYENVVAGTGTDSLKNLANGATAIGTLVENSTRRNRYCALELKWTLAAGSTTAGGLAVYLVPTVDGTNFATDNVAALTGRVLTDFIDLAAAELTAHTGILLFRVTPANDTNAHRIVVPQIEVPPLDFKFYVHNGTGQATANTDSASLMNAIFYNDRIRTY